MNRKFQNESLQRVCDISKEKGYKVYTFEATGNIRQVFIVDNEGRICTVSESFGGVRYATVHKVSVGSGFGTGFGITGYNDIEFASIEKIDDALKMIAPYWINPSDAIKVKKYANWDEYTKINFILKYYEL